MPRTLPVLITGALLLGASPQGLVGQSSRDSTVLPGLERPVEVRIDTWGVPHIYAERLYDAFAAQGFVAARDRLWQMDLWRKRGLGEMAKDFGPAYVESDRMARAVLWRGSLQREWLAYASDAKRIAEAFVAGVNAYVALTEREPQRLPEEFRLLGYRPSRWQAADLVRIRHHGLTLNLTSEIDRAEAYCKDGSDAARVDWLRRALVPDVTPTLVPGFDPCVLPFARLRTAYEDATARPRFPAIPPAAAPMSPPGLIPLDPSSGVPAPDASLVQGSNNWVVAPSRTATGRPVLASDPHRAHGAPSLRYISHLVAPGLDVIGAGEPFLPGISVGHTDVIAFGLTRFYMDQEDLYLYETNPSAPTEYRYKDRWEPMETITERIEVRGEAPRDVTIAFTRHGPVLAADPDGHRAFALRAAWLEEGMAPYFGSIEYMRARNWDQFTAAMNRWGAPGENQVYADTSGTIGWIAAGLTPIRATWDGLTPVPGDGRYEWAGFRDMDELPRASNPASGYLVTANENNIPADHPAAGKGIGYEWSDDSRARRLKQLLASSARHRLEDSRAFQLDTRSLPAQRVVTLLRDVRDARPEVTRALGLLRAWDGHVRADSAAAAVFEVWFTNHLRPAVTRAVLPPSAAARLGAADASRILQVLEGHGGWLPVARRDRLIVDSLAQALAELERRLGADMATWQWGRLHQAVFDHPLAERADAATRSRLTVGAGPLDGSSVTPMAAAYGTTDYRLTSGASFRMVADVGQWDASMAINTPGQSGDPASSHYRDLAPLWVKGGYFPLVYSRQAVERETRLRIVLSPR
ncbi:penicillin amidase [Luteitalea sp. TBR-22]|uniref:penicillin acylase family protein n=1 Tax=Luteitalea sp. TBR-22 TaxID=2802971 RepID=UPI001AF94E94|nr:penicillin acylase family protein [Luteitalea sp. TBR-22]BCS30912.1 penicillin amidase [Luteitalea sp. TBR-22]